MPGSFSSTQPGALPISAEDDATGELLLVLTTMPDAASAEQLARSLVEEQLIACANLVPGLLSVFRWKGEIQAENEVLLLIKTRRALLGRLGSRLTDLHPYDVPEMLALPVEAGLEAYCRWVADETGKDQQ